MTTEKLQTTNSASEQSLPRRVVRFLKDGRLLTRQLNSNVGRTLKVPPNEPTP